MGRIQIDPDAPYFRGHFPERPILPGVVQLMLLVDDQDPTTQRLLKEILASEEEHAEDLSSLLEGMVD